MIVDYNFNYDTRLIETKKIEFANNQGIANFIWDKKIYDFGILFFMIILNKYNI